MKNILIISKRSFFSQRWLKKKLKNQTVYRFQESERFRFYDMHKEHEQTIAHIKEIVSRAGIPFYFCFRNALIDYGLFDFIITIGGDGTFLHAARKTTNQTILGVNSDPTRSVGRFCAANRQNFKRIFLSVYNKRIKPKNIKRLSVWIRNSAIKENVTNDLLICDKNPAAMSRYVLQIGQREEYQRSSGLWVATAPGSSGAIQSAGQKAISPYSLRSVYQPRELYYKKKDEFCLTGGVVLLRQPMRIRSQMLSGVIFLDGAHKTIPFAFGQEVCVGLSKKPLHVIGPLS